MILEGGRILQPPGAEPYRADVAFDVLDDDPALAACPDAGPPGPSRIREVGDGRLLVAARRRSAADRLLTPALAASVRGLGRELVAVGRSARRREPARRRARALARGGRGSRGGAGRPPSACRPRVEPSLEVAEAGAAEHALVIPGPPPAVSEPVSLASALAALTGGAWREPAGAAPLSERLGALVGARRAAGRRCGRTRGRRSWSCARSAAAGLDAGSLAIESVYLDGREVGAGR